MTDQIAPAANVEHRHPRVLRADVEVYCERGCGSFTAYFHDDDMRDRRFIVCSCPECGHAHDVGVGVAHIGVNTGRFGPGIRS